MKSSATRVVLLFAATPAAANATLLLLLPRIRLALSPIVPSVRAIVAAKAARNAVSGFVTDAAGNADADCDAALATDVVAAAVAGVYVCDSICET